MSDSKNAEQMQKILRLQGKLTLHRLAWAGTYKKNEKDNYKLEEKIEGILDEMNNNQDPEFLRARKSFKKNKLSRTALANILPFVKNILNTQNNISDENQRKKFILQDSDVKLLGILAEKEAVSNDLFDHLLLADKSREQSILNFTKIIDSSMRNKLASDQLKNSFASQIKRNLILIDNEILKLPLSEPCKFLLVNQCHSTDYNPLSTTFMSFLGNLDKFDKHSSLRYGDIWLDTRNRKYVKPESIVERYRDMKYQVPEMVEEITISAVEHNANYIDHLASRVLDRYPYFTTRNELLDNKELLFSLVDTLDKNQDYFIYQGNDEKPSKRSLPEGYNKSNMKEVAEKIIEGAQMVETGEFSGISDFVKGNPKAKRLAAIEKLKLKVPKYENRKLRERFHYHLIAATFGGPPQKVFEFQGKLYDTKTAKAIDPTLQSLLSFENLGHTDEQKPIDIYESFSDKRKETIHTAAENGKKTYIFEKKVYHIGNSEIDVAKVVKKKTGLSLQEFNTSLAYVDTTPKEANKTPEDNRLRAIQAIAEGDRAIVIGPNIVDPKTMKAYSYTQQESMLKLFQNSNSIPRTNYVSVQPEKRDQWFMALMNNAPTFIFRGKEFNTLDAKKITDPLVKTPEGMVSYTSKKELVERLNQLDDKNLIIEYHKNFKSAEQCSHYSIVDKNAQTLTVHDKSGKVLFSKEVILGTDKGDQRLVFREYKDKGKETNGKTSAGVFYSYEFRTSADDQYYDIFNGCSLAMVTEKGAFNGELNAQGDYETVLAMHQVPLGYENRNPLYNNGDAQDNRASNGCINLTQPDCHEYKAKFADQGCPIYVLPEEQVASGTRTNRMKVAGDRITFTPVDRSSCSKMGICNKDYYYSPTQADKKRKIDIKILNPAHAANPTVISYVKTLEEKKEELSQKFHISDAEYNDLASMAYAIMGIESGFGEEGRYLAKEGKWATWFPKLGQWVGQLGVSSAKKWDGNESANSRGLTQIKNVLGYTKKHYPEINEDNLTDPKNAAIATIIALKEMSVQLNLVEDSHNNVNPENRSQFLYYIYNGATSQVRNGAGGLENNVRAREIKRYLSEVHIYEELE
jgi:hypothetical protein